MKQLPTDNDLRQLVHFSPQDGRIWLAGNRMVLMHVAALGAMRRELMHSIGFEQTKRIFIRAGHTAGKRDAELARLTRPQADISDMFATGPQLHMLEGSVQVTPLHFEADMETGYFSARHRWDHSWEVEAHVAEFGQQESPICWMLVGYASGYSSEFMRCPIFFKEQQCTACGHDHCLIEGKPLADWPDASELLEIYNPTSMLESMEELVDQVEQLRATIEANQMTAPPEGLIGRSKAFRTAFELLKKAAQTNVTVLLTGETGVGKERFARALHVMSRRSQQPFVAINCAALPHELIESELFGAEKGAFTGANTTRIGRFERANNGTLFLDEIGELPLAAQAKLLRVLQEGEIERLGGSQTQKIDVRLVTATNVDLEQAVANGTFRRDLYYRLNVYPVRIPPLRERNEDISLLATHLLKRFSIVHGKRLTGLTDRALDALNSHDWPGNVRELENLIERGVILASADMSVDVLDLFPGTSINVSSGLNLDGTIAKAQSLDCNNLLELMTEHRLSLDNLEEALIQRAVEQSAGNISAAARMLGISRPQLSYRLGRRTIS